MSKIMLDRFDSAGDLKGKARTYEAVKARVLECGRFSVFEAIYDPRIFNRLRKDPDVTIVKMDYPWIGCVHSATPVELGIEG